MNWRYLNKPKHVWAFGVWLRALRQFNVKTNKQTNKQTKKQSFQQMVLDQIHTHIQELSWTPTVNNSQKLVKINQI